MTGATYRPAVLAFTLGLALALVPAGARAGVHLVTAEVSVAVHRGNNATATPGAPCRITEGGTDYANDFMLLWFDFSGWPTDPGVTAVTLRLTRSYDEPGIDPDEYVVRARGFYAGNDAWYAAPDSATGNWQRYDPAGGHLPWKDDAGADCDVEAAGNEYLGGGNTWNGDVLEIALDPADVEAWITGARPNNGLRLYGDRTRSDAFYGAAAADVAHRPTLLIEAEAPEPASLGVLLLGAAALVIRRRS